MYRKLDLVSFVFLILSVCGEKKDFTNSIFCFSFAVPNHRNTVEVIVDIVVDTPQLLRRHEIPPPHQDHRRRHPPLLLHMPKDERRKRRTTMTNNEKIKRKKIHNHRSELK